MTSNQLFQVLRAYATHSTSRILLGLWLFFHGCIWVAGFLGQVQGDQQLPTMLTVMLLVSNLILGRMLSGMLQWQFANLQARLAPNYAGSHLVVAGGIAGAAIATEAVLVSAWTGPTGLLAQLSLSVLAISIGAWTTYSSSPLGSLLYVTAIFAPVIAQTYVAAAMEVLTDRPLVSLGIGGVGLLTLAALGVRLRTFREDMREGPQELALDRDLTSRTDDHSRRRREAQVIARSRTTGWLRDAQFRLVLRRSAGTHPWRRLLLRQAASGFSCVSAMTMVFSYILFVLLFQSLRGRSTGGDNGFVLIFGPLLTTLIMQAVSWDQYWPNLARESLRPVSRKDFIGDLARSMALDMAGAAAAHCALLVVWLKLFSPQGAVHGLLLPWLALTVVQYVLAYCLMLWLLTFRSLWALLLGFAAACGIPTVLVVSALSLTEHNLWSPLGLAVAIIVTALGSVLLYQSAFRRWCYAELD